MGTGQSGQWDRADRCESSPALATEAREVLANRPELPLPGRGATLQRWQILAGLGGKDLCLAKLLEAHYDAQAIVADLAAAPIAPGELWAVWAAEPPHAQVRAERDASGHCRLRGTKAWCSGADLVSHALMTVVLEGARHLVRVRVDQPGVLLRSTSWQAVGMSRIVSGSVEFQDALAEPVGAGGDYLDRPGFWHGGAGIAACWFGATCAVAERLRRAPRAGSGHAAAHLGWIDAQLAAAAALLRETAARIDRTPSDPHVTDVLRVRSVIERLANAALDRVGRALGPGPLCQDGTHAQRCADLAVFVRQHHAEHDWETLGARAAARETGWSL